MYHDTGLDLVTILPDDLRLCRRVPAPQAVPAERVLEALRRILKRYYYSDLCDDALYDIAREWLDAQQQGER